MRLNMHIVRYDLAAHHLEGTLCSSHLSFYLTHVELWDGASGMNDPSALYVADARDLPSQVPGSPRPNVLVVGVPPEPWLRGTCNVLYEAKTQETVTSLANEASRLFARYAAWGEGLQAVRDERLPLDEVGRLSQSLVRNPFVACGTTFRFIFRSFPEPGPGTPEWYPDYVSANSYDATMMASSDVFTLAGSSMPGRIAQADVPTITDEGYGYRTLVMPVRANGSLCAYLAIDEVVSPLTERDEAIALHLGTYLGHLLEERDVYELTHPAEVWEVLDALFAHRLVPEHKIRTLLDHYGWEMSDEYVVVELLLPNAPEGESAIEPLAITLSGMLANDCYVLRRASAVFVFNLTNLGVGRDALLEVLERTLAPTPVVAYASNPVDDFKNVYYYWREAHAAGELGRKAFPARRVHRCEDHAVESLVVRCLRGTIADALIPEGVKRLLRYDAEHGTDLAHLLDVFLRNERGIAKTIRQEYIHRNTFLYRLRRIEEISELDLDDEDTRLRLLVAFRVLERSS